MNQVTQPIDEQLSAIWRQGGTPEELLWRAREPFEAWLEAPGIDLKQYSARSANPYARYLLSKPDLPIELYLALWMPGTESPIHDHQGLTGAVAILAGELVETRYELTQTGDKHEIAWQGGGLMQPGLASPIYPQGLHQVHRMYNPGATTAASVHLYFGKLTQVTHYLPVAKSKLLITETHGVWHDGAKRQQPKLIVL